MREVRLERERKWNPRSRAHLEAFQAKLLAVNPDAEGVLDCKRGAFSSLSSFRCVFHVCLVMILKTTKKNGKHLVIIHHSSFIIHPRFFAENRMNRLLLQRLKSTSPAAEHIPRSSASVHQR